MEYDFLIKILEKKVLVAGAQKHKTLPLGAVPLRWPGLLRTLSSLSCASSPPHTT